MRDQVTDLESIKLPYVIKDKILMSPGVWNTYFYSADSIERAFENTDWEDKEIRSLYADHDDAQSVRWVGEVKNVRKNGDNLVGDLIIVDKPMAQKIAYGAKFGISPKVHGMEEDGVMEDFVFDNMSVVINPAVKTAYINNKSTQQLVKAGEDVKKPYGDVDYADPGYRDDEARYPIDTEKHVRSAWSYINMPKNREFYTPEQLKLIEARIKKAAERYGIDIENMEVKEMAEEDAQEKPVEGEETQEAEEPREPAAEEPVKEGSGEAEGSDGEEASEESAEGESAEGEEVPAAEEKTVENAEGEEESEEDESENAEHEDEEEAEEENADSEMPAMEVLDQMQKMLDMMRKMHMPAEEAENAKKAAEEDPRIKEMSETIKKMSERMEALEVKAKAPELKKTVKTAEMSEAEAVRIAEQDPDRAFLSMLQGI